MDLLARLRKIPHQDCWDAADAMEGMVDRLREAKGIMDRYQKALDERDVLLKDMRTWIERAMPMLKRAIDALDS